MRFAGLVGCGSDDRAPGRHARRCRHGAPRVMHVTWCPIAVDLSADPVPPSHVAATVSPATCPPEQVLASAVIELSPLLDASPASATGDEVKDPRESCDLLHFSESTEQIDQSRMTHRRSPGPFSREWSAAPSRWHPPRRAGVAAPSAHKWSLSSSMCQQTNGRLQSPTLHRYAPTPPPTNSIPVFLWHCRLP